jgi:hypothetical protein
MNIIDKINKNSLGLYIPYSLLYNDTSYEYIDEFSIMISNFNSKNTNMFEWNIKLNTILKNLLFIYIHIISIPLNPFLNRSLMNNSEFESIITYLKINILTLNYNQIYNITETINIIIMYISSDKNLVDFVINKEYNKLYSYEMLDDFLYLYYQSNRSILDTGYLYLSIDSNDNLNMNNTYNTTNNGIKYNFKLNPLKTDDICNKYIYYKANFQYIMKTQNNPFILDKFNVKIYDGTFKPLNNPFINNDDDLKLNLNCSCELSDTLSCYCKYLRHPLYKNNQIDISFKLGKIHNEIIKDVFY